MKKPFYLRLKQEYIPSFIYMTFLTGFFGSTLAYPRLSYLFLYRIFLGFLFMLIFMEVVLNRIEIKKFLNFSSYFLVGWITYSLLSFLWVQDVKSALRDQIFLTVNIMVVLIFMYYSNYIKWNILENIILFSYVMNIMVGYWEVITDKHLWTSKVPLYNLHRTPSTFFTNPNDFATYLVLYLPFVLNLIVAERTLTFKKLVALVVAFLSLPLLILTTSRANYIAFILALVIYFLLIDSKQKRECLKYVSVVFLFLIILVGFKLDFGFFNKMGEVIAAQLSSLSDFSTSSLTSNVRRTLLIVYGLSFLYDYLFLGVGAGNSRVLMEKVKQYTINVELHNWFLDVLVCYGLVVFMLYIIWISYIVYRLFQIKKLNYGLKLPAISTVASLMVFGISSISSSKMIEMRIMWFLFAIALFLITSSQDSKGAPGN